MGLEPITSAMPGQMLTLTTELHEAIHGRHVNIPFHSSWKVTKLLRETKENVDLAQLEKWK